VAPPRILAVKTVKLRKNKSIRLRGGVHRFCKSFAGHLWARAQSRGDALKRANSRCTRGTLRYLTNACLTRDAIRDRPDDQLKEESDARATAVVLRLLKPHGRAAPYGFSPKKANAEEQPSDSRGGQSGKCYARHCDQTSLSESFSEGRG